MAEDFGAQVQRWKEETARRLDLVVRKSALGAFSEIIDLSPVDTGRFRGNWQASIGSPATGERVGDPISQAVSVTGAAKAGDTIYMVNNLPYAQRLEYGWSKQAPQGMVGITVARWQPIVDEMVAEVRNG